MLAFPIEGAAHGGKSVGERKNVRSDEQVGVLRADRMPVDAVRRNRDFRHQIGASQRDTPRGEAAQRNVADHTILVRDLLGIEEATELLGLGVGRDGRRQPHPKLFRASALDTAPCARPRAPAAMAVVPRGLRAVEADLQGHTIARQ